MTSVLPIDALLGRIRACITTTPCESIVSLTINVEMTGEKTMFRLIVQQDRSLVSLLESNVLPSIMSAASQACCDIPQQSIDIHTDNAEQDGDSRNNALEDEQSSLPVQEGAATSSHDQSLAEDCSDSDTSASSSADSDSSTSTSTMAHQLNGVRRSGRQQHPPDRLRYPAAELSVSMSGRQVQRKKRSVETKKTVDAEDSTDTDSSEWTDSSSSSHRQKRQRQRWHDVSGNSSLLCGNTYEQEEIASLVVKLQEAYSHQHEKKLDLDTVSKQAVLQLSQEIWAESQKFMADGDENKSIDNNKIDTQAYEQSSKKIDILISTSAAMRMIGYYLRGVLAARLQQHNYRTYGHSAKKVLGIKSSSDITAYPAFYLWVQKNCPSIVACNSDINAWLQEPIFLADVSWSDWRRLLSKSHRWIIDTAMQRFRTWLQPPDWMQRGWVEEYYDASLGRGIRAVRDILQPTSKQLRDDCDRAEVVADLELVSQGLQQSAVVETDTQYRFEWKGGKQQLDTQHHWVGRINHLPMEHCNLTLRNNGKLVQCKDIAAGEPLTFDYGVEYWAHRVTGVPWNEWMDSTMRCNAGSAKVFDLMHKRVLDYTQLLEKGWAKRLTYNCSNLERQNVLLELWESVATPEELERERHM